MRAQSSYACSKSSCLCCNGVMVLCRVRINYRETIPLHAAHRTRGRVQIGWLLMTLFSIAQTRRGRHRRGREETMGYSVMGWNIKLDNFSCFLFPAHDHSTFNLHHVASACPLVLITLTPVKRKQQRNKIPSQHLLVTCKTYAGLRYTGGHK